MKKLNRFKSIFFIQIILTIFSGFLNLEFSKKTTEQYNKPDASNYSSLFFDHFSDNQSGNWCKSGIWCNGGFFNCEWHPEQVNLSANDSSSIMTLTLNKIDLTSKIPYKSGEIRSKNKYGYGLFEVKMKPVLQSGVVSSFFVYTSNIDEPGNPWDEIDIEFIKSPVGSNSHSVMQCNYYSNGIGNNEYKIKLNFDATLDYHVYAFKWEPNKITWYIDGNIVHSTAKKNIPNHAGKIMMNLWPTINADFWTGKHDGKIPLTAYYEWVRYTPLTCDY
jgi:endo-1,3-1,4-beta-glycanase ExoK